MNTLAKLKRKKVYIISPHFDDAVLSCGQLMSELRDSDLTVVNVFTKAHAGPYTLSAKKFIRDSGENDAEELFAKRAIEDKKALSALGVKIINLGLEDALFRRRKASLLGKYIPEFDHLYPIYRIHATGDVMKSDECARLASEMIKKATKGADYILIPYGIGNHVDHQIVRRVCEKLFTNVILYADFPYTSRNGFFGKETKKYKKHEVKVNIKEKAKLIMKYKSQFMGLFPDGEVPGHSEFYFAKQSL